jgi:hypothetical protein
MTARRVRRLLVLVLLLSLAVILVYELVLPAINLPSLRLP